MTFCPGAVQGEVDHHEQTEISPQGEKKKKKKSWDLCETLTERYCFENVSATFFFLIIIILN